MKIKLDSLPEGNELYPKFNKKELEVALLMVDIRKLAGSVNNKNVHVPITLKHVQLVKDTTPEYLNGEKELFSTQLGWYALVTGEYYQTIWGDDFFTPRCVQSFPL